MDRRSTRRVTAGTAALALAIGLAGLTSAPPSSATDPVRDIRFASTILDGDALKFGNVAVGSSASTTLTVSNAGDAPLTISGATVKGAGRADYAVTANTCTVLDPQQDCTMTVTWTPTFDGENIAGITLDTDATTGAPGAPGPRAGGRTTVWLQGIGYGTCDAVPFSGGDGTPGDPYVIETLAQFNCISAADQNGYVGNLAKSYVLANDLDAGGVEGAIRPVSTWWTPFTGTLDGQGHAIRGFTVADIWSGLFVWTNGATVRDLVIEEADVTAMYEGGILIGYAEATLFEDITIDGGAFTSTLGNANGGAFGYLDGSQVNRVHSSASVTVTAREEATQVGGLVGVLNGSTSTMTASSATGSVTVTYEQPAGVNPGVFLVGGLVGAVYAAAVSDVYATGAVSMSGGPTETYVGGLVGSIEEPGSAVERGYATGTVRVDGSATPSSGVAGGLAGRTYNQAVLMDSLWDSDASGNATDGAGATARTTAQMRDLDSYAGWTIAAAPARGGTWTLLESGPPVLSWTLSPSIVPASQSVTGTVGASIQPTAALSPSWFSGAVSYSVSPALPDGLSIDASTGVISGTPTTAAAAAEHVITATGAVSGSATAAVTITIAAASSNSSAPQASTTPVASEVRTPVSAASSTPPPAAPSTAPASTAAPQPPRGVTLVTDRGRPVATVVRSPASTLAKAPTVTAVAGAPVSLTARGLQPGATYEVRMRTGSGEYVSLGSSAAGRDGTLRLPAFSARAGMKVTIALLGADGAPAYMKVEVTKAGAKAGRRR